MLKSKAIIIYLALFSILSIFVSDSYCDTWFRGDPQSIAGPILLYPITDDIVLSGKDYLEFKWIRNYFVQTEYFDFRLYKGYNTTAANRIFKQSFSSNEYPIRIPVALFEENQVYTWVLVLVFYDGRKSDKSFSSFKIIKK
jgi:hypothetical protein